MKKEMCAILLLASSSAVAVEFSSRYENDNDGAYKFTTQGTMGKYGVGISHTVNQTSPFIMYDGFGVYLNKAPYLFFDKEWKLSESTTVSLFLDSLDYRHKRWYSDNLWFAGVSVGTDFVLTEKDTIALHSSVSRVSDSNWKQVSRVNYTREFYDGLYGLVRYKNSTNSAPSDYYYSLKVYNSLQTGLMVSEKFGQTKVKAGATVGYFETNVNEGFTSEAFLKVGEVLSLTMKYEEGYSYGQIGVNFVF